MTSVTRADLAELKGITPKLINFFATLFGDTKAANDAINGNIAATGSIQAATVLVLSPNAAFDNERVLALDPSLFHTTDGGSTYTVTLANVAKTQGGFQCILNLRADTAVSMPNGGRIPSSIDGPYASDAAAAAAGIQIGEWYAKSATGNPVVWRAV